MNWTASMYANQPADSFSFQRRRDLMFYPWLARRDSTYHLGNTAAKVRRSYEKIRSKLVKPTAAATTVYPVAEADDIIAGQLFTNWQFPDAASTLLDLKSVSSASTNAGRRCAGSTPPPSESPGSAPARPPTLARRGGRRPRPRTTSRSRSAALDRGSLQRLRVPARPHQVLKRADADAAKYRFIGYSNTVSMCSYWKFAPTARTVDLDRRPDGS